MSTKIEIKIKKASPYHWSALEEVIGEVNRLYIYVIFKVFFL